MTEVFQKFKNSLRHIEDFAPLALRLLLAYVFYQTGIEKLSSIDGTAYWFESLGIPFPTLNAYMAMLTEVTGVLLLTIGLGTRIISIPLLVVLLVAMLTVHLDNGWLVIGSSLNDPEIANRVSRAKDILKEYGNWDWLSAKGTFVILQNGFENVVTYMAMLLTLLVYGPGKFSVDALIEAKIKKK
jgi:uncharacterized membrane protein YphA (DoxX/SURF4 family)